MGITKEGRRVCIRGNLRYFLCIKLRRKYGEKVLKYDAIRKALNAHSEIEQVSVGDRDVSMYINGAVDERRILYYKLLVAVATDRPIRYWAVGYYLATVGNVDIDSYKAYIAGL